MSGIAIDLWSPIQRWQVWTLMAGQDVRIRYKRSLIGPFWVSITMATFVLGIGTLYAQVFNQPFEEYLVYFGTGMLAWTFLVGLIQEGAGAIIESEGNLRSISLPIPLLVTRVVWRNFIVLLHNAIVILAMIVIFGHEIRPIALLSLVGIVLYVLIGFFVGITLAPLCTRFRDVTLVIQNVIQIMFFLTPIFWMASATSSRPFVTQGNPFFHLLALVREPLLGAMPTLLNWAVGVGVLVLTALLAVVSLAVSRKKIVLWL